MGTLTKVRIDEAKESLINYNLIIWNDNVNDMGWVIIALEDICKMGYEKAYDIMLEAHLNGKAVAKTGLLKELEVMQKGLNDREINASIEAVDY